MTRENICSSIDKNHPLITLIGNTFTIISSWDYPLFLKFGIILDVQIVYLTSAKFQILTKFALEVVNKWRHAILNIYWPPPPLSRFLLPRPSLTHSSRLSSPWRHLRLVATRRFNMRLARAFSEPAGPNQGWFQ